MGTKTRIHNQTHHSHAPREKKIPKHGDENGVNAGNDNFDSNLVKKESPNMRTKTIDKPLFDSFVWESEKRIPKHGDENFF